MRRRPARMLAVFAALTTLVPMLLTSSLASSAHADDPLMTLCLENTGGDLYTLCTSAVTLSRDLGSQAGNCVEYIAHISPTRRESDPVFSACQTTWDTANEIATQAVDATLYCAGLGTSPGLANLGPVCKQLVADAITLAGDAATIVFDCVNFTNETCRETYLTVAYAAEAIVSGTQWCLGLGGNPGYLTIGEICRQTLETVKDAADDAVATAQACAAGTDARCAAVIVAVQEALAKVLSLGNCASTPELPADIKNLCVPTTPDDGRLLAIAKASIEATDRYRVEGQTALQAIASSNFAPNFSSWFARGVPKIEEERAALTQTRVAFNSFVVNFSNVTFSRIAGIAVLGSRVEETLGMAGILGNGGVPPTTASGRTMYFTFVPDGNGDWQLAAVDDDDFGGLYYVGDQTPAQEVTEPLTPERGIPITDTEVPQVADIAPVSPGTAFDEVHNRAENDSNLRDANNATVANYAVAHSGVNGHAYNSAYHHFQNNDCTNLVSQSLEAGGWVMTPGRGFDPTREWWYDSANNYVESWTVARLLYEFIQTNQWATAVGSLSQLRRGDVLQAKLGNYHANKIHHSTVVTARDNAGNLYLTYHTSDHENIPYAMFLKNAGKGTTVYGWHIK